MQLRGQQTMGVDQTTSSHGFESLPDGGRIVVVRNVDDPVGVARVRAHLRDMQRAFAAGDFSMPMFIHMKTVPGVSVMATRHNLITYAESDLPNGGALRIATTDAVALAALSPVPGVSADRAPRRHCPLVRPVSRVGGLPDRLARAEYMAELPSDHRSGRSASRSIT
jgi:hypothetical protein